MNEIKEPWIHPRLSDFLKAVITECCFLCNSGTLIYNGKIFYVRSARLNKNFEISKKQIQELVDLGYAEYSSNGAIQWNFVKINDMEVATVFKKHLDEKFNIKYSVFNNLLG